MNVLRETLEQVRPAYGGWCHLNDTFAAEVMGRAGYDWMCVDLQHGQVGPDSLIATLQVLNKTDTPTLVRLPWKGDHGAVWRSLDYGAQGVIVPMIDSVEEAAAIAAACRYPPDGARSWAPIRAALEHPDYSAERANEIVICLIMIETRAGLAQLDEIVALPGVDGVFVGPADLGLAHGLTGSSLHDLIEPIVAACERHGKLSAVQARDTDDALGWARAGMRLIGIGADSGHIESGARAELDTVRAS